MSRQWLQHHGQSVSQSALFVQPGWQDVLEAGARGLRSKMPPRRSMPSTAADCRVDKGRARRPADGEVGGHGRVHAEDDVSRIGEQPLRDRPADAAVDPVTSTRLTSAPGCGCAARCASPCRRAASGISSTNSISRVPDVVSRAGRAPTASSSPPARPASSASNRNASTILRRVVRHTDRRGAGHRCGLCIRHCSISSVRCHPALILHCCCLSITRVVASPLPVSRVSQLRRLLFVVSQCSSLACICWAGSLCLAVGMCAFVHHRHRERHVHIQLGRHWPAARCCPSRSLFCWLKSVLV